MTLEEIRVEIDNLDAELVQMLGRRSEMAIKAGQLKKGGDLPVFDAERENKVLARVRDLNEGPLSGEAIELIYRQIIAACLDLEK